MRSRIAYPGGWASTTALQPGFEVVDPCCVFCSRFVELGWLHLPSSRLVCNWCLRDPWADEGEAGKVMAEKLLARLEADREAEVEVY